MKRPRSLAFIIDAFDREIIGWTAIPNAGISGSEVHSQESLIMTLSKTRKAVHAERILLCINFHKRKNSLFAR
jgi:hypothetical protein